MKGNFNKIINGQKPVLIDFHAEWCGPCKAQAPVIKALAKKLHNKIRIIKIDIDRNQSIAQKYNVRSVPTLALFQNGQLVWHQPGLKSLQQIQDIISRYIGP